ncbi:MAG: hypothetical protein U0528_02090 [Anaerolineae bacterium]
MRKFIAALIILFILFPIAFAWLGVMSFRNWIFDRQFYVDIVDDERFYQAILSSADTSTNSNTVIETSFAGDLPAPAVYAALREVIEPVYVRDQAVKVVNAVFDSFEGVTDKFTTTIDLKPIKAALSDPEMRTSVITAYISSLAPCKAGQESVVQPLGLLRCLPEDQTEADAIVDLKEILPSFVQRMPDELPVDDNTFNISTNNNLNPNAANNNRFSMPIGFAGAFMRGGADFGIIALFVAGVVVWIGAALIASDSWRGRLLCMGISLLLPALFYVLLGASLNNGMTNGALHTAILRGTITGIAADQAEVFRGAVADVASLVVGRIGSGLFSVGGVAALVSAVLIVLGFVLPNSQEQEKEKFKFG